MGDRLRLIKSDLQLRLIRSKLQKTRDLDPRMDKDISWLDVWNTTCKMLAIKEKDKTYMNFVVSSKPQEKIG